MTKRTSRKRGWLNGSNSKNARKSAAKQSPLETAG